MTESFAVEGERLLALILVINSEGFQINNLFQLEGRWRANLTDRRLYWDFGDGESPQRALEAAWQKVKTELGVTAQEGSGTAEVEKPKKLPTRRVSSAMQSILELDLDL
jgi:hypothetical protein